MKGKARQGFTIVEVLVSLALMAAILLPLAGVTFTTVTEARRASRAASISAAVVSEGGRYAAMPYAALDGAGGCVSVSAAPAPYTRCVTVSGNGNVRRVKVVIRPVEAGLRGDSVILDRGTLRRNPLDTP